jgi:hypothetical protein
MIEKRLTASLSDTSADLDKMHGMAALPIVAMEAAYPKSLTFQPLAPPDLFHRSGRKQPENVS